MKAEISFWINLKILMLLRKKKEKITLPYELPRDHTIAAFILLAF